jgi:hypothetical protein
LTCGIKPGVFRIGKGCLPNLLIGDGFYSFPVGSRLTVGITRLTDDGSSTVFEDDGGGGKFSGMSDGEGCAGKAEACGDLCGAAEKAESGTAAGFANDFDFEPGDAVADAGTEGLGAGLLGGKAGGEALGCIAFAEAVGLLRGSIDAVEEAASVAIHGALDAANLNHIDSRTNDHAVSKLQHFVNAVDKAG